MHKTFIHFFTLSSVLLISTVFSQTHTFFGRVLDKNTGEPLIGVYVFTTDKKSATESDSDGYFYLTIKNEYSDTAGIVFQYIGYRQRIIRTDSLINGREVTLTPFLIDSQDSIQVISDKFGSEPQLSHQYIQPATIKNSFAIGDPDIFRYLSTQPGVSFTNDVSNKIYIRGMRSDKLFILFDDFVLYNPYHLVSVTSSIDIGAINTVELFKSVYPVNESGRTGGMLKIYTKKGNSNNYIFNLNMSLMSSILRMEGPAAGGSFMVSLRRTYIDFITDLFSDRFPYSFFDGIFKINFRPKNHSIEISGIKSNDFYESSVNEDSKWSNAAVGINWKYYLNPRLYFHNNISYSEYSSSFYSGTAKTSNRVADITFKSSAYYRLNFLNSLLNTGFSFHSYDLNFNSDEDYLKILDDNKKSEQADVFVNISGNIMPNLKYSFGLSAVWFSILDKTEYLPLIRLNYSITDSIGIAAGYAKKVQFLNTVNNERDYLPPFNIWRTIDKTTGSEVSRQLSLSVFLKQKKYKLKTELYYNYLPNIVDFNRHYIDNEDPLFLSNDGESYGIEFSFNYLNPYFYSQINYSLSRTVYSMFGKTYYPSFHRLHKFDININSRNYKGWTFSVHWIFSSGRPYTGTDGFYYLYHFLGGVPPQLPYSYYTGYNLNYYPAYHRLDLHVNKYISNKFHLFFDLINLYNKKNIFYYENDNYDGTKKAVTMLPILPNIGFEYRF